MIFKLISRAWNDWLESGWEQARAEKAPRRIAAFKAIVEENFGFLLSEFGFRYVHAEYLGGTRTFVVIENEDARLSLEDGLPHPFCVFLGDKQAPFKFDPLLSDGWAGPMWLANSKLGAHEQGPPESERISSSWQPFPKEVIIGYYAHLLRTHLPSLLELFRRYGSIDNMPTVRETGWPR